MTLDYYCKPSGLYVISKTEFDKIAHQILLEKQPQVLNQAMPLDIDSLINDGFNLECVDALLSKDESILGLITFVDQNIPVYDENFKESSIKATTGTIFIDKRLKQNPTRCRFTKAHEISHWILHRKFYSPIKKQYNFRNTGCSFIANRQEVEERKNPVEAKTDVDWSEWQSDCLGAALLMPSATFIPAVKEILKSNGFLNEKLEKGAKDNQSMKALHEIASLYKVSVRSVRIRLYAYNFYL